MIGFFSFEIKNGVLDVTYLFQYFVKHSFRVSIVNFSIADEDVSHSLRDELKTFHVVLVFVQFLNVVFYVDLLLARLLLHFVEKEAHVLVGSLSNLRSDANVGDRRPGIEEIVKKFHEISLTNSIPLAATALVFFCYHLE